MMLNRYTQRDQGNENITSESDTEIQTREIQVMESTLAKYEEIDNESPETETDSQIDSNTMSGSEEEEINYGDMSVNREDLPRVDFDYKNKNHVEKVIEAANNNMF